MSDCRRILVVEDNELNLKLVRDVLRHAGYEVVEARTGEQGVALAAECRPDLVLMDLQLPGIDGIEALRQLSGPATAQDGARRRGHRVRDAGGSRAGAPRRLRRLRGEAVQCPRAPRGRCAASYRRGAAND